MVAWLETSIEGLIKTKQCCGLLVPKVIWRVSDVSWRIILESRSELRRLISSSFSACGSREGSTNESWNVKVESSDLAIERVSWLGADSSQWGSLWLVGKKEFSKRQSKISLPYVGVLCANEPPAVMSISRADFMSKPEKKMFNNTLSDIDKSGIYAKVVRISPMLPLWSLSIQWGRMSNSSQL